MKNNIPEVGKIYAFFDDGKTGFSRRYKATVLGIIPFHLIKAKYPELYCRWKSEIVGTTMVLFISFGIKATAGSRLISRTIG